jgi:methylated-DNA-[protein]-cysteine S-methyltransferase
MPDAILDSPVGLVSITTAPEGISHLDFIDALPEGEALTACPDGLASEVQSQLKQYFEGARADFDLPLHFVTGSEFQRRVWQAIASIPFGATMSYGELAYVAGHPGAARAVGTACAQNPIGLLVPCHRVIASDGGIGG